MKRFASTLCLVVTLVSCVSGDTERPLPAQTSATTAAAGPSVTGDLTGVIGREYRVAGLVDHDIVHAPPPGTEATVRIDIDGVTGSAGCNTYSAPVAIEGDRIQVGAIALTERACLDTSDWAAFLDILSGAVALEAFDGGLVIRAGQERAVFLQ